MIAEFLIKYGNGLYKETQYDDINCYVKKHKDFNTISVFKDKNGIYAVARWNVDTSDVAHVIDSVVRPDKRGINVLKDLIKDGRKKFPHVKYIRYERGLKGKAMRMIKLDKFKEK